MEELDKLITRLRDEISCSSHFQERDAKDIDPTSLDQKVLITLVSNIRERTERDARQIIGICDEILKIL